MAKATDPFLKAVYNGRQLALKVLLFVGEGGAGWVAAYCLLPAA